MAFTIVTILFDNRPGQIVTSIDKFIQAECPFVKYFDCLHKSCDLPNDEASENPPTSTTRSFNIAITHMTGPPMHSHEVINRFCPGHSNDQSRARAIREIKDLQTTNVIGKFVMVQHVNLEMRMERTKVLF
jgi:hypothetical protein